MPLNGKDLGPGCETLFSSIQRCKLYVRVIPYKLYEQDESLRAQLSPEFADLPMDENDDRDLEQLQRELCLLRDIVEESQACLMNNDNEAHWNAAVHGPLLRIAFGRDSSRVGWKCV